MSAKTRIPQPKEKQVQAAITRNLKQFGAAVYDTSQPFKAAITPGVPDLIVFCRGRMAFVEVKRDATEKMKPAQEAFAEECATAGVEHHCWSSAGEAVEWVSGVLTSAATGAGR